MHSQGKEDPTSTLLPTPTHHHHRLLVRTGVRQQGCKTPSKHDAIYSMYGKNRDKSSHASVNQQILTLTAASLRWQQIL